MKDQAYVTNLEDQKPIETHQIALYLNGDNEVFFDRFGVKHIVKEFKKFKGNKIIKINIFRIQANFLVMCWYFYIGLIDFVLKC